MSHEKFKVKVFSQDHQDVLDQPFSSLEEATRAVFDYAKETYTSVDYFVLGKPDFFGYFNWDEKKHLLADQVLTKGQVLKLKLTGGLKVKYKIFKSKSSFFVKGLSKIISIKENDVVINKDLKQIYPADNFKRFNRFIYSAKQK